MDNVSLYGDMRGSRWREKVLARIESQEALEASTEAIGQRIPQATLSRILSGESKTGPKWHHMVSIAAALRISLDYLADDEQDEPDSCLSEDEVFLLNLLKRMDVSPGEIVRFLKRPDLGSAPTHGITGPGLPGTDGPEDLLERKGLGSKNPMPKKRGRPQKK